MTNFLPSNTLTTISVPEHIQAIMLNMKCDENLAVWLYEQSEKELIKFKFSLVLPKQKTQTQLFQEQFASAVQVLSNIGEYCMIYVPGHKPPITEAKISLVKAAHGLSFAEMIAAIKNQQDLVLALKRVGITNLQELKQIDPDTITE